MVVRLQAGRHTGVRQMRGLRYVTAAVAASLLAALSVAPAYAATDVLTVGSVGGPNVAVGDSLSASGPSSLKSADGSLSIQCSSSTTAVTVDSNPPAPGTAQGSVDSIFLSGCVATGGTLQSVSLDHLPYVVSLTSAGAVTVSPGSSGLIQVTIRIAVFGVTATCIFRPHGGSISGAFSNADSTVTFNQQFDRVTGPPACPASLLWSATLRVTDGGQPVFVN